MKLLAGLRRFLCQPADAVADSIAVFFSGTEAVDATYMGENWRESVGQADADILVQGRRLPVHRATLLPSAVLRKAIAEHG